MGDRSEPATKPVLFACTLNCVRSVMAEAMFKDWAGRNAQSCGVMPGPSNGFTVAVMQEIELDVSGHITQDFDSLSPDDFSLLITMSPEANAHAASWAGTKLEHQHWAIPEPGAGNGNREVQLNGYRSVRDEIAKQIRQVFQL